MAGGIGIVPPGTPAPVGLNDPPVGFVPPGTAAPVDPRAPKNAPKPSAPPGKKAEPIYGWWRPSPTAKYQRWIKGWKIVPIAAAPATDPGAGGGGEAAPEQPAPAAPTTPFDPKATSYYQNRYRQATSDLNDKRDPILAKIQQLQFRSTGPGGDGLTEFERRRNTLDQQTRLLARSMADEMASAGLLRSGARNRAVNQQTQAYGENLMGLRNEWGDRAISNLEAEKTAAETAFNTILAGLADEATSYYRENPIGG